MNKMIKGLVIILVVIATQTILLRLGVVSKMDITALLIGSLVSFVLLLWGTYNVFTGIKDHFLKNE